MDFHVVREGRKVKSRARFPNLVSGTGHSLQNYNNDFYEAVNIAVSQRMWSSVILKLDKDKDYQEFLDFERFSVYEEFKKYRLFNPHQIQTVLLYLQSKFVYLQPRKMISINL